MQIFSETIENRLPRLPRALMLNVAALLLIALLAVQASAQQGYELDQGDKLRVTVFGHEDASGEVTVGSEGTISLPLLGSVSVEKQTLSELETTLLNSFSEALGRPISVRVELLERRPFYVVGAVNTPGSYPYRPDISVLHAVAIAGGLESILKNNAYMFVEATREKTRLATELENLKHSLAQYSRLTAERNGLDEAAAPAQLIELAGREEATAIMAEENEILQEQVQRIQQQVASYEEATTFAEEELVAYEVQLEQLTSQEPLIKAELDRIRGLKNQGLVPHLRVFELERVLSELNADKNAMPALIARAKQNIASTVRSAKDLQLNRNLEVNQQIADLRQEIAEAESKVRGSSLISQLTGGAALPLSRSAASARYEIVRQQDGEFVTIPADELTPVLPGDVVCIMIEMESLLSKLLESGQREQIVLPCLGQILQVDHGWQVLGQGK